MIRVGLYGLFVTLTVFVVALLSMSPLELTGRGRRIADWVHDHLTMPDGALPFGVICGGMAFMAVTMWWWTR